MIIVTGTLLARPDSFDSLLELCLEHVRRSRLEPGCILHSVHRDVENALRLVFLEKWVDLDALEAHFAVPASCEFVRRARELSAQPGTIEIFSASAVDWPPG